MSAKIIVSYDGTANEDDAIALGRLFGRAGAEVSLAYVRHTHEADSDRETVAESQAHGLLERGVELLGNAQAELHVVTDRSTPEGLASAGRARGRGRDRVLLGLAHGEGPRLDRQLRRAPARRRPTAIAIAPADLAETAGDAAIRRIVAVGDGDGGARETAEALAGALGATVEPVANERHRPAGHRLASGGRAGAASRSAPRLRT